ncbi:MAG: cardiolipin synthase [Eubacterium sp.]|nr:cardiolipin synthase [Eubacterium sp.]MDD7209067.1 cardiolipin synthase [Lachnospiraceae bacterium]MDY5496419.1 cardiolipin synthase [Anaerobutyricum sp.]
MKKKGIKGFKTIIFGRTLFVILAFLVQFALIITSFLYLKDYSIFVYGVFIIIGIFVILHLYNGRETPEFKLVWMLPILIFPVFGAIFYLYIYMQPGTKLIRKRLDYLTGQTKKFVVQDEKVRERFQTEESAMSGFVRYMYDYGHCPVYDRTEAVFYPLGDYQYKDILTELKKAEKFIFLEFFIVEEGHMWDSILEILKQKVKEGVEVRFMYDGMCALALVPYFYPKMLEEEGIRCKMFSPIRPVFSSHYNNRDHRKILVIDGKVAFTGGTNLADEYINEKERFGHWKDTAIKIEGKAVEKFTYLFLEMWNISEQSLEDYERYRSPEMNQIRQDGYFIPYGVSPFGSERIGKRVYLDILNTAQHYVHIMTPYLILDYEMMMALVYAAKRGVDVKIIMPHIPDKKYAFYVAKTYYNELLEAGISIYEYTPGFVHAKIFVSDDEKAVVGTVNLDYRSFYHHFECGIFLYKNSEIAEIEKDYGNTLEKCQIVTEEDYGKQKLICRIIGKVLRIFAPLM